VAELAVGWRNSSVPAKQRAASGRRRVPTNLLDESELETVEHAWIIHLSVMDMKMTLIPGASPARSLDRKCAARDSNPLTRGLGVDTCRCSMMSRQVNWC
jgi:hypothetical protein